MKRVQKQMARRFDGLIYISLICKVMLGACDTTDDTEVIAEGRRRCLEFAAPLLDKFYPGQQFAFDDQANVSDDPTHNTYEFTWTKKNVRPIPDDPEFVIFCRGDGSIRTISILHVNGKSLQHQYKY